MPFEEVGLNGYGLIMKLAKRMLSFCYALRLSCAALLIAAPFFSSNTQAQERIIFSDTLLYELASCDLDGANYNSLAFLSSLSSFVLAHDYLNDKLYWTDSFSNVIVRADMDGSNRSNFLTGLSTPVGIAVDPVNSKLYYTQADGGSGIGVFRVSLDGSNQETLIGSGVGISEPRGVALDLANGKMYFSDTEGGNVLRANLDGSAMETVADGVRPRGVYVDTFNDKVYWADSGSQTIERSNLDGTNREVVVDLSAGSSTPQYVVFNPEDGRVYWTDQAAHGIYRSLPAPAATPSLLSGTSEPQGIVLILNCTATSPDSDADGTPDCNDGCPGSSIKTSPGVCGCNVDESDGDKDGTPDCTDNCPSDANKTEPGQCGCGFFDVDYGAGVECEDAPALTPGTEIEEAADVTVTKTRVRLVFEDFSGGTLVSEEALSSLVLPAWLRNVLGARTKLTVRYLVVVRGKGSLRGDVLKRTTKRNTLTLRNLEAGKYSVRYKAQAVRRNGKVAFSTKLSPGANFTVRRSRS